MKKRVQFLAEMVLLPEKEGTLVVAHNGINRRVLQALFEKKPKNHDFSNVETCVRIWQALATIAPSHPVPVILVPCDTCSL